MRNNVLKLALSAAAFAALPGVAYAGTGTATGSAALNVTNQCSVTGATVDLGTYRPAQTWGELGAAMGSFISGVGHKGGTLGATYLNYGSITCVNGLPYVLQIQGSFSNGAVKMTLNGKNAVFVPFIAKVGGVQMSDGTAYVGGGRQVATTSMGYFGTGAAQSLVGSISLTFAGYGGTVLTTDTLGAAGTFSDTLTYTLTF